MAQKTWKVRSDSLAGMKVTTDSAMVSVNGASGSNGLYVDQTGVYIKGSMSIMASPDQIRLGGFWTFNNPWQLMLPSTMAFPVCTTLINPPIKGIADMAQSVTMFMEMLV